ncbi:kinesin-like protein KIN-14R [Salvia splendens]|uniref:kinesin-like protein KIN-14R n=1 Tax=Salvia splendens TaxID=180675 RepID=UPI001C26B4C1|nr:kinesin-like protein KIN-14R [Salvia splendens]
MSGLQKLMCKASGLKKPRTSIAFRNSKLTHLLQDPLGGDSKTSMCAQIRQSDQDLSETLSSFNFANRVRGVESGNVRKQVDVHELQKIKTMLEKARLECKAKDESVKRLV